MSEVRSGLQWALELAARGLLVFPLRKGTKEPYGRDQFATLEHPGGRGWADIATSDAAQIVDWSIEFSGCNWGVCPGDRYAVVDLDVKPPPRREGEADADYAKRKQERNGVLNWEALELVYGEVSTFRVRTPSGGVHLYFVIVEPTGNAHSFPRGIDVRGARGYVVGPGCALDEGGEYVVEHSAAPAAAPDWVRTHMRPRQDKQADHDKPLFELDLDINVDRGREFLNTRKPAVSGQGGNNHTYATFCHLKDFGLSDEKALELVMEEGGWNERCEPPWDLGEIAPICEHAYSYGNLRPGSKGGGMMDAFVPETAVDIATLKLDEPSANADEAKGLPGMTFRGSSITKRSMKREMIVADWLLAHGLHALLASRGKGKTTTMLDMALRIVCDMDWHEVPVSKEWCVVYLCGEDDLGAALQIEAWQEEHGVNEIDPDRFIFMNGVPDLLDPGSTKAWTEHLLSLLAGRRTVVFLDTWQRATSSGSQNENEEMNLAVHHAEAMAKSLGGPVVAAFHPPKNSTKTTIMGSSVIENATSAIWALDEHGLGRKLEVIRIKGRGVGNYQLFRFEVVKLLDDEGIVRRDEFNRDITSVIPHRLGSGNGVVGTQEEKQQEVITNERARSAYAQVIKVLDAHRQDPYFVKKGSNTPLTINAVSEQLAGLRGLTEEKDVTGHITERAAEAKRLLDILATGGVEVKASKTMRDHLTDLFRRDKRGHSYGDGHALRLNGEGKQRYFNIQHELL